MEGMRRFNADDEAERLDPTVPSSLDRLGGDEELPPELKADGDDEKPGVGDPDEEM